MASLQHDARGLARGVGDGAPLWRTGSVPVRARVGIGEPEPPDRTGSAAVPGSSGGESFRSRARYDDHGPERNLDETGPRPGGSPRRPLNITIGAAHALSPTTGSGVTPLRLCDEGHSNRARCGGYGPGRRVVRVELTHVDRAGSARMVDV